MDTTNLVAWLPFDDSTTQDLCGNTWTATGNPTIGTNGAISGNALQLNGSSYLQKSGGLTLGGQDFTICGWAKMDSSTAQQWGGLFALNGNKLRIIRYNALNNAFERGYKGYLTMLNISPDLTTRFHFELDYQHSTGKWFTFFNGNLIETFTSSLARTTYSNVYVGQNGDNRSDEGCWGGSIDEFQIYDGVALHTANFTPPTAEDYAEKPANFAFDLRRRVKNAPLTWRYENAGDADDLILTAPILTDLPATKSKFGVAFYQTTRAKCFDLPATPEIWLKIDVYFDGSNRWRAFNGAGNSAAYNAGVTAQTNGMLSFVNLSAVQTNFAGVCKTNQLQTVLLHMVSDSSAGVVEAWVDGTKIYRYTGNVNQGNDFADIYLQSDGSGTFFSNVIISNSEIGLDEDVARAADEINFKPEVFMSWLPTGEINFKPEVFASWIPTGEINFKPEIFATLIEGAVPCEFNIDLRRTVTRSETATFDLRRKLINSETADFDLRRTLVASETFSFDLRRSVANRVNFTVDLRRKLVNRVEFSVDLKRTIVAPVDFTADLRRFLVNSVDFTFDLNAHVYWQWLTRILPESSFLDSKMYASAEALDVQITKLYQSIREVLHLPRLDELSGTILDLLAEQFHVDYYDAINFSDEEKRNLIRQSIAWHRLKGTPAAVEMVLQDAFKDLRIDEWFTYGGEPYFFRLWTKGYISTPERFKSFWLMFMDAKNVRSQLEMVTIDHSPDEPIQLYTGVAKVTSGLKIIDLPKHDDAKINLHTGVAIVNVGQKIIGLPKHNDIHTRIYSGVYQIHTGTIFIGMKRNPF